MTKTVRITLLALTAGALVAAGCGGGGGGGNDGGGESGDYGAELTAALTPLGSVLTEIGAAAQSAQNKAEVEAALSDAQGAVDDASTTVSGIDAPSDLEDENDDLVAALDGFSQALADARAAVESGDNKAVNALVTQAQSFAGKLGDIKARLVDAGVKLNAGG